jgi:hypothetical protein
MKVLIGCEYSGIIREAFKAKGFDAWSCDILPTEIPGNHIQDNILNHIGAGWNLLIAFPPCKYLSAAGLHFCNINAHGINAIERIKQRHMAVEFFLALLSAPIKHIAIENPTGYINSSILKPTQIIHPYYFGESEMKRTCLWLKNLPPIHYNLSTNLFGEQTAANRPLPYSSSVNKKTGRKKNRYFVDAIQSGKLKSSHNRSKSFNSIAQAMATQWASYLSSLNITSNNYKP